MQFIDLKKQYHAYKKELDTAVQNVLEHGAYILGPEVHELKEKLAKYTGAKHCLPVSSGTDSLLIALLALDIKPGDEVITTPFTFIAPAEMIALIGAKPVFVDIDPETYNLDPLKLEAAITPKTKAIIPVSLYGHMADLKAINTIAERHNLPVIEDAAQSFGARYEKKKSCAASTIASTSFYPAKPLGCYGEGGALFTDNDVLAEKMESIHTHGSRQRYSHSMIGVNGRFDTIQAAVLLVKLKYYDNELIQREKIADWYQKKLEGRCTLPTIKPGYSHTYAQYTIRVPNRDAVVQEMSKKNIPVAIHYSNCLHQQPVFASLNYNIGSFPEAEKASQEVMSLPMHPFLLEEECELISSTLCEVLEAQNASACLSR